MVLVLAATTARAGVVSWNFDRYGTVDGSRVAGVIPAANWNNSWPSDPTVNLMDDAGDATSLDISYTSYNTWTVNEPTPANPGQDADSSYNRELLNGYLNAGNATWNPNPTYSQVVISQIPYANYDIIVYFSSDAAGREGEVTNGATTYSFNTVGQTSVSGANALLLETTDTSGSFTTTANYAVFSGLTSATQTITVQMRDDDEWGGIAGFQVSGSGTQPNAQILSAKRGIGDAGASYAFLQAVNASWYHTWGTGLQSPGNFDALHIPMYRWWHSIPGHTDWILNRPEPTEWVMCFNEPERSDQDNLTVAEAITRVTEIAAGLAGSGIKIASPAVSDDGAGQAWLASFMSQANTAGLPIDAVCFHWYGAADPFDPVGAANAFLSRVDSYHNSYGLPVFISEFAIHDWGGAYPVEDMRTANKIFLQTVIPGLEARSYVAGYAWYNWFSDSPLVEGSPLAPTEIGVEYVGVLNGGDVYDVAGTDLGEHVAYLRGGELTNNSTGGVLRYINALDGLSTMSGSVDWSMAGTNWVRVQPGATLRKAGANLLTWTDTVITNEGVLEVTDGEVTIDNDDLIDGAGLLRVASGGTVSFHGARRGTIHHDIELDGGIVSTDIAGGFDLQAGQTLSGDGVAAGGLIARSGATVRVGVVSIAEPATLTVNGDLTLASGTTLELGMTDPNNADLLNVTGQLKAAGTLEVLLRSGASEPQPGDAFNIIDAGSVSGAFGAVTLSALAPGNLWDLRELYTTGVVSVLSASDAMNNFLSCLDGPNVAPTGGCGTEDQDADNDVDVHDLAAWQSCVTNPTGVLMNDCLAQ